MSYWQIGPLAFGLADIGIAGQNACEPWHVFDENGRDHGEEHMSDV